MKWFDRISDATVRWAGSAWAVIGSVVLTLVWAALGPVFHFSDTWQLWANTITTILTFIMVFVIQHAVNKDSAAVQAKLDALIKSIEEVPNAFVGIDEETEEEIEAMKRELRDN